MLSNPEIVERIQPLIDTCISYQTQKFKEFRYIDDLRQDINLILLEYDNTKMNSMYEENHLNAFITRILVNQLFSKTSPYYRTYKKFLALSDELSTIKHYTDSN